MGPQPGVGSTFGVRSTPLCSPQPKVVEPGMLSRHLSNLLRTIGMEKIGETVLAGSKMVLLFQSDIYSRYSDGFVEELIALN